MVQSAHHWYIFSLYLALCTEKKAAKKLPIYIQNSLNFKDVEPGGFVRTWVQAGPLHFLQVSFNQSIGLSQVVSSFIKIALPRCIYFRFLKLALAKWRIPSSPAWVNAIMAKFILKFIDFNFDSDNLESRFQPEFPIGLSSIYQTFT